MICGPGISKDLLTIFSDLIKKNKNNSSSLLDTFEDYYHILQYSLPAKENLHFYKFLKEISPEKAKNSSYEYLASKDPINNFKDIYLKYSVLLKDINDKNSVKIKKDIQDINSYVDNMLKVYDINLNGYYYPPMKEYPTYVYNFYSYLFFETLKKFRKKRIKQIFKNNKNKDPQYTEEEYQLINYSIATFFKEVYQLFENFNYKNIDKDLKILKILIFYFKSFEYSRNFLSNGEMFLKIIKCLNSEPITSDVLKRIDFFRKGSETPIQEEEWNDIKINEIVYNKFYELAVKIKYFKKDILKFDNEKLIFSLKNYSIEKLNMDGLINNSITKFSPELEKYTKELLKSIFSSEIYIQNFLKHDKRFNSQKKKNLFKSIFEGPNSNLILNEIWENIFFIPFLDKDNAGFNCRSQYSIFIRYNPEFDFQTTFQKIIPYLHCEINTLYHEFTHNIALLLAANLEDEKFETIEIDNENELEELINLQKEYFKKYKQNNKIYTKFEDFGDLMEVLLFGIRPRKFRTLSGLFCLQPASYSLDSNEFKEKCVNLYNYEPINDDDQSLKESTGKCAYNDLFNQLLNSNIAQLLKQYFIIDSEFINETYIEDGKPREISNNFIYNEEVTINIDYCDKL